MKSPMQQEQTEITERFSFFSVTSVRFCSILFLLLLCSPAFAADAIPVAEGRDAVRREWTNARRLEANEKFYQELLKRYAVTIERPKPMSAQKKLAEAGR